MKKAIFWLAVLVVIVAIILSTRSRGTSGAVAKQEGTNGVAVEVPEQPRAEPAEEVPPPDVVAPEEQEVATPSTEEVAATESSADVARIPDEPEESEKGRSYVEIPAGTTLATVNGAPITLKQLAPGSSAEVGKSQHMRKEIFDKLLKKAIETEATFQEAGQKSVALTPDQKLLVEAIRSRKLEDIANDKTKSMQWTSETEERVAFQQKYVESLLLQQNLMAKDGKSDVPTISEADVEQFYQRNKTYYGELPEDPAARAQAWAKIKMEITGALIPYTVELLGTGQQKYAEKLVHGAQVNISFGATP